MIVGHSIRDCLRRAVIGNYANHERCPLRYLVTSDAPSTGSWFRYCKKTSIEILYLHCDVDNHPLLGETIDHQEEIMMQNAPGPCLIRNRAALLTMP